MPFAKEVIVLINTSSLYLSKKKDLTIQQTRQHLDLKKLQLIKSKALRMESTGGQRL
jgi:hypothetical protein